jgi:hypothetical protein
MPAAFAQQALGNRAQQFGDQVVTRLPVSPLSRALGSAYLVDLIGAGDEIRTHDPNLGKVVLYP